MTIWTPQLGPQVYACSCPADEVMFGGSRGGGKTDVLIGRHLLGVQKWGRNWAGLVVRRRYKDFNEMRRRWDELISLGLPAERVGGENQANYIRFDDGASVSLMAFQRLEQFDDIQGHQYPEVSVDEATNFPWFVKAMDKLRATNRSPHGIPTRIFCTGNPGGPGHAQVKSYFKLGRDGAPPLAPWVDDTGTSRVYIRSRLQDNRILVQNDPKYVARLQSIRDPALRAAWLQGDWDVYIGQAFALTERHIVPPHLPPPYAPVYMTFDWGFGKPFSVMWWWFNAEEDRITGFAEWYGWNGIEDEGMRMQDSLIAEGILEREHKMGLTERAKVRLAGPDCWNKKPDYRGSGQGPSTAEVFADKGLVMRPGDPSREFKLRQFRERLALPRGGGLPGLVVTRDCRHFLRTIPSLVYDDENPEYLDEEQELHAFDSACHIVMARAKGLPVVEAAQKAERAAKEEERKKIEPAHAEVWRELDRLLEKQQEEA